MPLSAQIGGLVNDSNQLTAVPNAALTVATNVEVVKPGLLEPRRGISILPDDGSALPRMLVAGNNDYIFALKLNQLSSYVVGNGSQSLAATVSGMNPHHNPYGGTARAYELEQAAGGFSLGATDYVLNWIQTSKSVFRYSGALGTAIHAGVPRCFGLDRDLIAFQSSGSGFLANQYACLYRFVFRRPTTGEVGAPSPPFLVTNVTGTATNMLFNVAIQAGISQDLVLDVYRSPQVASASSNIIPPDTCQFAFTYVLGGSEFSNFQTGTITDTIPDTSLGAALYTNADQEGSTQAAECPPLCYDITQWNGYQWYAAPRLENPALLTDSGVALTAGNTVTIQSTTFTARASPSSVLNEFKTVGNIIQSAYYLSQWYNHRASDLGLKAYLIYSGPVAVTNCNSVAAIAAAYPNLGWGSLVLINNFPGDNAGYTVTSGLVTSLTQPANISSPGTLLFSKLGEYEACPQTNTISVGGLAQIQRIMPLRQSLIVWKDDGVYRLTGTDASSFQAVQISTYRGVFPNSVAGSADAVYGITAYGALEVTESGFTDIGFGAISSQLATFRPGIYNDGNGCAVVFWPEGKYICYGLDSIGIGTTAYVYSSRTKAWSIYRYFDGNSLLAGDRSVGPTCAIVGLHPTNSPKRPVVVWLGVDQSFPSDSSVPSNSALFAENPGTADTDYCDTVATELNITAGNGTTTLTIANTGLATPAVVGAKIVQGLNVATVTSVTSKTIFTVDRAITWTVSPGVALAMIYPINAAFTFVPQFDADADGIKQTTEFINLWKYITGSLAFTVNCSTELVPTPTATTVTAGTTSGRQATRQLVPRDAARGRWLTLAYTAALLNQRFQLEGLDLPVQARTDRFRNG